MKHWRKVLGLFISFLIVLIYWIYSRSIIIDPGLKNEIVKYDQLNNFMNEIYSNHDEHNISVGQFDILSLHVNKDNSINKLICTSINNKMEYGILFELRKQLTVKFNGFSNRSSKSLVRVHNIDKTIRKINQEFSVIKNMNNNEMMNVLINIKLLSSFEIQTDEFDKKIYEYTESTNTFKLLNVGDIVKNGGVKYTISTQKNNSSIRDRLFVVYYYK